MEMLNYINFGAEFPRSRKVIITWQSFIRLAPNSSSILFSCYLWWIFKGWTARKKGKREKKKVRKITIRWGFRWRLYMSSLILLTIKLNQVNDNPIREWFKFNIISRTKFNKLILRKSKWINKHSSCSCSTYSSVSITCTIILWYWQ